MRIANMIVAATLAIAGFVGGTQLTHAGDASIRRQDQRDVADVYCPAEDTCKLDYDGGLDAWVISRKAIGTW